MSADSFRGTVQQCVNFSPLDFYLWGHLKTLAYLAAIEIDGTLQPIFHAC
jgi:hypothetical protein